MSPRAARSLDPDLRRTAWLGDARADVELNVHADDHLTNVFVTVSDPRTGGTASVAWAQVTCAGVSAVEANAASTAAIVLGADAPAWLTGQGIPARLDGEIGRPVVTPGWPSPERQAA